MSHSYLCSNIFLLPCTMCKIFKILVHILTFSRVQTFTCNTNFVIGIQKGKPINYPLPITTKWDLEIKKKWCQDCIMYLITILQVIQGMTHQCHRSLGFSTRSMVFGIKVVLPFFFSSFIIMIGEVIYFYVCQKTSKYTSWEQHSAKELPS